MKLASPRACMRACLLPPRPTAGRLFVHPLRGWALLIGSICAYMSCLDTYRYITLRALLSTHVPVSFPLGVAGGCLCPSLCSDRSSEYLFAAATFFCRFVFSFPPGEGSGATAEYVVLGHCCESGNLLAPMPGAALDIATSEPPDKAERLARER